MGEVFLFVGEVRILGRVRLSRLFCGREAQGKTSEGESPLFRRGGLSPSKPPSLTENFPHVPATYEAKICFAF